MEVWVCWKNENNETLGAFNDPGTRGCWDHGKKSLEFPGSSENLDMEVGSLVRGVVDTMGTNTS